MIDPNDPGTMDLVAACQEPLSNKERQRRFRARQRKEREAGKRVKLELKAPELAVLSVALAEFRERWTKTSKAKAADSLLPRLPLPNLAEVFPGDSAWLPDIGQQSGDWRDEPGTNAFLVDSIGLRSPLMFRQTPIGQPEVDALVFPGDTVWTSYGSGPYVVKQVAAHECRGMRCFTLVLLDLGADEGRRRKNKREPDGWINDVVAVDGRLLKLFANNQDEVFVARTALAGGFVELDEAEAVRAECRRITRVSATGYDCAYAGRPPLEPSFDELALKLLSHKDRTLLEWARRNEQLVRETPADQAYPVDPEKRNLLGQALNDLHDLNGRYQVLLDQALELYELVDLRRYTPRLSSPASFLAGYKRDSESYATLKATEGGKAAANRFAAIGRPNEFAQLRQENPGEQLNKLYALMAAKPFLADVESPELVKARAEVERLQAALQQIAAEVAGTPNTAPARSEPALVDRLRAQVQGLQKQNATEIADRARAFDAVAVLQARLRKAGLPHDYRALPGE